MSQSKSFSEYLSNYQYLLLMLILLILIIGHIPLSVYPLGRDQAFFIVRGMALGAENVLENSTNLAFPGMPLVYNLLEKFTDNVLMLPMLAHCLSNSIILVALFLLLKETIDLTAAICSIFIFSLLWPSFEGFWNIGQKDIFGFSLIFLATAIASISFERKVILRLMLFMSGMLVSMAAFVKPTFIVAGPLIAIMYCWYSYKSFSADQSSTFFPYKQFFIQLFIPLSLLLAGALTVVCFWFFLVLKGGGFDEIIEALFIGLPGYINSHNASFTDLLSQLMYHSLLTNNSKLHILELNLIGWVPLTLLGFICFIISKKPKKLWVIVPLVTAIFSFLIQGKGIPYHVTPYQTCLFYFAGLGLSRIIQINPAGMVSFIGSSTLKIYFVMITILLGYQFAFHGKFYKENIKVLNGQLTREEYLVSQKWPSDIADPLASERLAAWIKEHTEANDKIVVWGFECQVYAYADRMFSGDRAIDYFYSLPVEIGTPAFEWREKLRSEYINALNQEPPKIIIVTRDDINAVENEASDKSLEHFIALKNFINTNYVLLFKYDKFDVYVEKIKEKKGE